jgi:predicted dehydrogenase
MFIDKPMAASLTDAMIIFWAAKQYGVPVFSSSSLRYIGGMDEVKGGSVGKILGTDAFSPATLEESHPDLFWYGIHGVETLFTAMGTGCKTVTRVYTPGADVVTGIWEDGRIGTFRGIRDGKRGYGGTIYGEKNNVTLGTYAGYNPLLKEIVKYFETGIIPVAPEETLEILAFMEAADLSKKKGGKPVSMEQIMEKSRKDSRKSKR